MDILGILLLIFLGYSNSIKAKQKGQNGILWAILTIVSYIIFEMIGLLIVISVFCRGVVDMSILNNANNSNFNALSQQFSDQVTKALTDKPLKGLLVVLFGIGGYLLIRFILERKPDKPDKEEREINWIDKLRNRK